MQTSVGARMAPHQWSLVSSNIVEDRSSFGLSVNIWLEAIEQQTVDEDIKIPDIWHGCGICQYFEGK
jgi:hypothetical protein